MSIYWKEFREASERMAGEFPPDRQNPTSLDKPLIPYAGKPEQYDFKSEDSIYTKEPTNFGVGSGSPQQYQVPNKGKPSIYHENDSGDIENPYRLGKTQKVIKKNKYEGW